VGVESERTERTARTGRLERTEGALKPAARD
jgi:hypothetical protein